MNTGWPLFALMALLGLFLIISLHNYQALKTLQRRVREQSGSLADVNQIQRAICGSSRHMGDEVVTLDRKLRRVAERQDSLELREPDLATYKQAINMAQEGAEVRELMTTCGLGRTEAELVHLMHQHSETISLKRHRLLS